jgi:dissimilatory sulfite reductase related protein
MAQKTLGGKTLEVDEQGYLKNVADWNEEVAKLLAQDVGIQTMVEGHWKVVNFMRERFIKNGDSPSMRTLGKESGVNTKELYQLFPKGPAKLAAYVAGIPKPRGCI